MKVDIFNTDKKYDIIYSDPPWKYKDKSKSHGGGAESHYKCMEIKEICLLPINNIANNDSVLCMWCTFPFLKEGIQVIESWGFKYITNLFTYIKTNKDQSIYMGMGRYTRSNAEVCLLGKKGKGAKRKDCSIMQVQLYNRLKHSEKPVLFNELIIKLFGKLSRIELFARNEKIGWDCWGNEV